MSGRPNTKWKKTMLEKFNNDEKALHDHQASIGSRGGRNGNTGGFASDVVGKDGLTGSERARIAGSKGGRISRLKKRV